MAHETSDAQMIATTHNTSRPLTKTRTVAWLTLVLLLGWGAYSYAADEVLKLSATLIEGADQVEVIR